MSRVVTLGGCTGLGIGLILVCYIFLRSPGIPGLFEMFFYWR